MNQTTWAVEIVGNHFLNSYLYVWNSLCNCILDPQSRFGQGSLMKPQALGSCQFWATVMSVHFISPLKRLLLSQIQLLPFRTGDPATQFYQRPPKSLNVMAAKAMYRGRHRPRGNRQPQEPETDITRDTTGFIVTFSMICH